MNNPQTPSSSDPALLFRAKSSQAPQNNKTLSVPSNTNNSNSMQLSLANMGLYELPHNFHSTCRNLIELNISFNHLFNSHLEQVCEIQSLRSLNAQGNKFTIIPVNFRQLSLIQHFAFDWMAYLNISPDSVQAIHSIQDYLENSISFATIDGVKGMNLIQFYELVTSKKVPLSKAKQLLEILRDGYEKSPGFSSPSTSNTNVLISIKPGSSRNGATRQGDDSGNLTTSHSSKNSYDEPPSKAGQIRIAQIKVVKNETPQYRQELTKKLSYQNQNLFEVFQKFNQSSLQSAEYCDKLLHNGLCNPDEYSPNGLTALQIAVVKNQTDAILYGIKRHRMAGYFDFYKLTQTEGKTLLDIAVTFNRLEIIKMLLDHGYDIFAWDGSGKTIFSGFLENARLRKFLLKLRKKYLKRNLFLKNKATSSGGGFTREEGSPQNTPSSYKPCIRCPEYLPITDLSQTRYSRLMRKLEIRERVPLREDMQRELIREIREQNFRKQSERRYADRQMKENLILYYEMTSQF